jgi:tRNA uridine 5-carboxymethylaminomethyl modification enzyme
VATTLAALTQLRVDGVPALDWLRRPESTWESLTEKLPQFACVIAGAGRQIEIHAKYAGYIARQDRAVERFAQLEEKLIPQWVDYATVTGLRNEAKQKLAKFTPRSLGQALRISGITPADVALLAVHVSRGKS